MAWELCTKEDVVDIYPTDESQLRDFWSEIVDQMIRDYLDQPTIGTSTVITEELHDGTGTDTLIPNYLPIISVQAIRISDASVSAGEYKIFKDHIQLLLGQIFPSGKANVEIDYTSGIATVSPTVRFCAASMIVAILTYRGRGAAESSIRAMNARQAEGGPTAPGNITSGLIVHLYSLMQGLLKRDEIRFR